MSKKVTSVIKINEKRLRQLTQAQITAIEQTAEALQTDLKTSETMPFNDGTMQNESTFVEFSQSKKGKTAIVTTCPQARRLYFHPEYNFQKINNANAGGKWFEPYLNGSKKTFCICAFKELFKRYGDV